MKLVFGRKVARHRIVRRKSSETDSEERKDGTEWRQVTGRSNMLHQLTGDKEFLGDNVSYDDPFSLYQLSLSNNLLELIVKKTNRYAVDNSSSFNPRKHQQSWKSVTTEEI